MDKIEFLETHRSLIGELYEYRDATDSDDAIIAARWLEEPFKLGIESNIETVKAIIDEAQNVASHFDQQQEAFRLEANRVLIDDPGKAKAWLEKMIPIWRDILGKLESKRRENPDFDPPGNCPL